MFNNFLLDHRYWWLCCLPTAKTLPVGPQVSVRSSVCGAPDLSKVLWGPGLSEVLWGPGLSEVMWGPRSQWMDCMVTHTGWGPRPLWIIVSFYDIMSYVIIGTLKWQSMKHLSATFTYLDKCFIQTNHLFRLQVKLVNNQFLPVRTKTTAHCAFL